MRHLRGRPAVIPKGETHPARPTLQAWDAGPCLARRAGARPERGAPKCRDRSSLARAWSTVEGDFADGLQGGPDFWEVRLSEPAGSLNVHDGASTGAPVIGRFPNTAILRNLGCRMAEGRRWCRVEATAPGGISGWVAGEFLAEASGQGTGPTPEGNPDRPVGGVRPEGSAFTATGLTECTLSRDAATGTCEFGVIREGGGSGTVMVFWPEGGMRALFFENGAPVRYDRSEADAGKELSVTRGGDTSSVFVGDERYVIPDAVLYGG